MSKTKAQVSIHTILALQQILAYESIFCFNSSNPMCVVSSLACQNLVSICSKVDCLLLFTPFNLDPTVVQYHCVNLSDVFLSAYSFLSNSGMFQFSYPHFFTLVNDGAGSPHYRKHPTRHQFMEEYGLLNNCPIFSFFIFYLIFNPFSQKHTH